LATTFSRDLERLTHSGLTLADPTTDLSGREVLDREGDTVGTIVDLLVDLEQGVPRLVEVETAGGLLGLGRKHRLIPVEALTTRDLRTVQVDRSSDEIDATPVYSPADGDDEEEQYAASYAAYGVTPYWQSQPASARR
jgi:sporulation protein YlmC with PRC-barrel domain